MPDNHTPDQRHRNMAAVHSVNTKPELKLRHELWKLGFRYLVNDKRLPGKPDIVLPKYRTVIFIHGCFWHGHNGCKHYTIPQTNAGFWTDKITCNQQRDQEVWRLLEAKGWSVIIVWECQLKKAVLEDTLRRVEEEIHHNGQQYQKAKEERKASRIAYQQERKEKRLQEETLRKEVKDLQGKKAAKKKD